MSLRLIYGVAGSGKSAYIKEELKVCAANGRRALLLVPEQASHLAESELIGEVGFLSAKLQATSFARLAKRCLAEAGRTGPTVDAAGKHMLMARALSELNRELVLYRGVWDSPGFLTALLELVSDLKRAQVSGEALLSYAEETEREPLFCRKLTELGRIVSRYESLLAERFADTEDYVMKLAALIAERGLFADAAVYLDAFFRFTANELDVVRSLLLAGAEVTVSVCAPGPAGEEGGIFSPCCETARRLRAIARDVGAELLPPVCLSERFRFRDAPELAHLEARLYRYPNRPYDGPTRRISLFAASDPYSEVTALAVEIRRAVCEEGLRYRDIAIIAGNLEQYQNLIKTVFPSYEIPVFIDTRRELLSHPVMLMLFSLFQMLTGGFRTQDVIAYCKTGYAGLSLEEADRLENYALEGGVERGDWLDDSRFTKRARSVFEQEEELSVSDSEEAKKILELKNRVFAPVLRLREAFSQERRASALAELLFGFLEEIGLRAKIEEQIDAFRERGERQLADEYADVYNLLIGTLDQMALCLGEEAIGLSRLKNILEAGFSQYSMGVIPSAVDQVFLGDVNRSLVKNVKRAFLVGATDGAFPPAVSEDGVLTDEERLALRSHGFELAPDTGKMAFDNRFLVYDAVNIASGSVRVSFPVTDLEGKGLRPSPLIASLRRLFPNIRTDTDLAERQPQPEKTVASRQSAYQYVLTQMAAKEKKPLNDEVLRALREDGEYREKLRRAEEYSHFSNASQRLARENVTALYGRNWKGSVSQFERFSACPFSYFIQYGLRAKERSIPELGAPDVGWLLHLVIDEFSKYMNKSGESYREMTPERCDEIVKQLIDEKAKRAFLVNLYSEKKRELLFRRLTRMVTKSVWAICEHVRRGEFEPCAYEVTFDDSGEMPPLRVALPTGETITLAGRIDRIDRYTDGAELYVRIIDYKSGNRQFRLSDVFHRLSLQLAVYLTAVCDGGETLFGRRPKPAGMFYFRLSDDILPAAGLSEEELQEEILKKYKMSGLVLSDVDIIRAMDRGFVGYSKVIPVQLSRSETIVQAHSKSATAEQLARLEDYIRDTVAQIGRDILSGNADISPSGGENGGACAYCSYKSICGFDPARDRIRYQKSLSDKEVWERLRAEKEENGTEKGKKCKL